MQQVRRSRIETAAKLFALGYPANAINKTIELGLPHLPWGNKGYLPVGLQELGQMEQAPVKEAEASPHVIERMLNLLDSPATMPPAPEE